MIYRIYMIYMYMCICVYVYMCVCVYVYICIYVYMYICIHVYMYICIYVYMYICIYVYMYICMYVYMYICIYVYMYICIYVFMYICIYVYMYICIYVCIYYIRMYVCMYIYVYMYVDTIYVCMYKYLHMPNQMAGLRYNAWPAAKSVVQRAKCLDGRWPTSLSLSVTVLYIKCWASRWKILRQGQELAKLRPNQVVAEERSATACNGTEAGDSWRGCQQKCSTGASGPPGTTEWHFGAIKPQRRHEGSISNRTRASPSDLCCTGFVVWMASNLQHMSSFQKDHCRQAVGLRFIVPWSTGLFFRGAGGLWNRSGAGEPHIPCSWIAEEWQLDSVAGMVDHWVAERNTLFLYLLHCYLWARCYAA